MRTVHHYYDNLRSRQTGVQITLNINGIQGNIRQANRLE